LSGGNGKPRLRGPSRKADQLPADEVLIAAIHRIGEEAFDGVLQQHLEEVLGRRACELEIAFLQSMQQLILLVGAKLGERPLAVLAAPVVHVSDRGAIQLRGRELELITLFLRALAPRSLHVPGLGAAIGPGQLAVDERRDTGFFLAGPEVVVGNQCGSTVAAGAKATLRSRRRDGVNVMRAKWNGCRRASDKL
jgi:hypothetical protein